MAVVALSGSQFMNGIKNVVPTVKAKRSLKNARVRVSTETVETGAADSVGSKYYMGRIASNSVISHRSILSHDGLGAATAPILTLGFEGVGGQITADPDALAAGIVGATAGEKAIGGDRSNYGKEAWQYIVPALTEDPGGEFDVVVNVITAAIDTAGTISLELIVHEG